MEEATRGGAEHQAPNAEPAASNVMRDQTTNTQGTEGSGVGIGMPFRRQYSRCFCEVETTTKRKETKES